MKLKLILKDGTEFSGQSFGYEPTDSDYFVDGEVVFNTGMVGYPESLTDPSYRGQILVLTYPMIGNYGVPDDEIINHVSQLLESEAIHIRGLIVTEYSEEYSHWQAKTSLAEFLKKHKVPAIQGVDTRALTQKLREHGVMLGKITHESKHFHDSMEFEDPNLTNLVAEVSCVGKQILEPEGPVKNTVVMYDCGAKHNIIRSFLERGVKLIRLPWDYDLSQVEEPYDAVFYSNGPGDPKLADKTIESIRYAMEQNKVIFGICLGSQLMGLAAGGNTFKLKYGHRSANQPCSDMNTGRCYITSQNHGFAVDEKSLPSGWKVWFKNANDDTVAGLHHDSKPWFSVQFHPEANPGPEDTNYLFDYFLDKVA